MFKFNDLEFVFENKSIIVDDPQLFCENFKAYATEILSTDKTDVEKYTEFIDKLLGKGMVDIILNGRKKTIYRLVDIMNYIVEQMGKVVPSAEVDKID